MKKTIFQVSISEMLSELIENLPNGFNIIRFIRID